MTFDWNEYPYQLQFLALYSGNEPQNHLEWGQRLGEPCSSALSRFLQCGLVRQSPPKSLEYIVSASDLKTLKNWCRSAGLPVSGNKRQIIERVVQARVPAAVALSEEINNCCEGDCELTEFGKQIVDAFLVRCPWAHSDDWFDSQNPEHLHERHRVAEYARERLTEMKAAGIQYVEILGTGEAGRDCAGCIATSSTKILIKKAIWVCTLLPRPLYIVV